jgi:hypothetical protein
MNFDENISMLSMAFYQVLLVSGKKMKKERQRHNGDETKKEE